MSYPIYTQYTVWFTDPAEYAIARLITGGTTFYINPVDAAAIFGITYPGTTLGTYPPQGDWDESVFGQKGIFSNDFSLQLPGSNVFNPIDTGIPLPPNVDSVLVPDVAGVPPVYVGSVAEVIWFGRLLFLPFHPTGTTLPQRRWIGSYDIPGSGEGVGASFSAGCRSACRTVEGIGASWRGGNGPNQWSRTYADPGIGLPNPNLTWERFYFRVNAAPSNGPHIIWRTSGSIQPGVGFVASINNSGNLALAASNAVGTLSGVGNEPISLGLWYQLDLFPAYWGGGGFGSVQYKAMLNKRSIYDAPSVSMNTQTHNGSVWGKAPGADTTFSLDMCDWTNMDFNPYNDQGAYFGTHMRFLANEALISSVGWTTNNQLTNQSLNANQSQNALSTSVTPSARVQVRAAYPLAQRDNAGIFLGEASAVLSMYSTNSAGTDGTLGINVASGLLSQNPVVDQTIAAAFQNATLRPFGLPEPFYFGSGTGVLINHDKSADAATDNMRSLSVVVEQVGMWNACDDYTGTFEEPSRLYHNAYYPNTPWALGGGHIAPPVSPVFAIGGTYVGNGTEQTITLAGPPHFLWIRGLTGAVAGVKWFAAGLGGHNGLTDRVVPSYITRVWYDDATKTGKFAVAGTDPEINAAGVTYQYIAFCDPGMRFNICGSYHAIGGIAMPIDLIDGNFTPQFGFNQADKPGVASNVAGLSISGPGFTFGAGQQLDGTAIPSWGTMTQGQFLVGSGSAINSNSQSNFSMWRTRDFTCGYVMTQITSYVGNNTNPRVIPLTPASLRVPLFVMVVAHANIAYMRDPSHAGANSCSVGTLGNTASAIVAVGVDQITIQSTINANGVIYEVFAICGDTAGMLNGTYYPPGCVPSFGPDAPWDIPPVDPAAIAIIGEGGLELGSGSPTSQLSLLRDISGIYTLVGGKTSDTLYDRQPAQTSAEHAIPNPFFETGYIGG